MITPALILLLAAPAAHAGAGSRGAEVLRFGAGPRAFAMAEAQAAHIDDAYAIHLNPAGLAQARWEESAASFQRGLGGVDRQLLVHVKPTRGRGSFGLGLLRLTSGDIEGYDASGATASAFDAEDLVLSAGWARGKRFGGASRVTFGASAKYLRSRLERASASTLAVDAGAQVRRLVFGGALALGWTTRHFGGAMTYDNAAAKLPLEHHVGLAWSHRFAGDPYTLALEAVQAADADEMRYMLGGEAVLKGRLAVRAGLRHPADLDSGATFGVGLILRRLRIDYAFALGGDFGPAHRAGLSYRWGEPLGEVTRTQDTLDESGRRLQLGRRYMREGRYAEALRELNAALELDPTNPVILQEMKKAHAGLR